MLLRAASEYLDAQIKVTPHLLSAQVHNTNKQGVLHNVCYHVCVRERGEKCACGDEERAHAHSSLRGY